MYIIKEIFYFVLSGRPRIPFWCWCLFNKKIPIYRKYEFLYKDKFVLYVNIIFTKGLDVKYHIEEIVDHSSVNIIWCRDNKNVDMDHLQKTFKKIIESYLFINDTFISNHSFFITSLKLKDFSEYKIEKRDEKISKLLN